MSDNTGAKFDILTLSEAELVDAACDRFETTWRGGDYPCIEGYLDAVPDPCRATLLVEPTPGRRREGRLQRPAALPRRRHLTHETARGCDSR